MASKLSASLPRAERTLTMRRWRDGYVCLRCFHQSRRQRAGEASSQPSSEAQTPRSPRRERAARASQDLADIASGVQTESSSSGRATGTRASDQTPTLRASPSHNPFDKSPYRPVQFQQPSRQSILRDGQGTATIAASQFDRTVADRLQTAMRPGVDTDTYLHTGSAAEHTALELQYEEKQADNAKQEPESEAKDRYAALLGANIVAGRYDTAGILGSESKVDDTMGVVTKAVLMNSTYLSEDARRFAAKVKALLPAATKARPAQKAA